jgi:hypothetical protein
MMQVYKKSCGGRPQVRDEGLRGSQHRREVCMSAEANVKSFVQIFDRFGRKLLFPFFNSVEMNFLAGLINHRH